MFPQKKMPTQWFAEGFPSQFSSSVFYREATEETPPAGRPPAIFAYVMWNMINEDNGCARIKVEIEMEFAEERIFNIKYCDMLLIVVL